MARFDRCTTCHQGLDKTLPGSAVEPLYRRQRELELTLPRRPNAGRAEAPRPRRSQPNCRPSAKPSAASWSQRESSCRLVRHSAGRPRAAQRRRRDGRAWCARNRSPPRPASTSATCCSRSTACTVLSKDIAYRYLVDSVTWGEPIRLQGAPRLAESLHLASAARPVRRLAQPAQAGKTSAARFATKGRGVPRISSGLRTRPTSPDEATRWKHEYGWFNNHHWIFPMNPQAVRREQLLEVPSRRGRAGAERAVSGSARAQAHGRLRPDSPERLLRLSRDQRLRRSQSSHRSRSASRAELLGRGPGTAGRRRTDGERKVAGRARGISARRRPGAPALLESIRVAAAAQADPRRPRSPRPTRPSKSKARAFAGHAQAGDRARGCRSRRASCRKVGPSLRHVADKLDFDFLYSWIRRPKDFRPTTKMPQFFGLWDHLDGEGLALSEKFEPIEIRGIVEYLLAKSQPFDYYRAAGRGDGKASADAASSYSKCAAAWRVTSRPTFRRDRCGKGPNLTDLGGKLDRKANKGGRKWLYSWLRNPSNYHPRTLDAEFDPGADRRRRRQRDRSGGRHRRLLAAVEAIGSRRTCPAAS